MTQPRATFNKDHEDIVQKFGQLIKSAEEFADISRQHQNQGGTGSAQVGTDEISRFFAVRTSSLNLLARVAGTRSIYYRTLRDDQGPLNSDSLPAFSSEC